MGLSTLPIAYHGFTPHKGVFRDALCLRYSWNPHLLPSHCVCGQRLTIEHALSWSRGGFPSIQHNEIRDFAANLMSEVCYGVGIEPSLQAVTEEQLKHKYANREDGSCLNIVAGGEIGNGHPLMSGFSTLLRKAISTNP